MVAQKTAISGKENDNWWHRKRTSSKQTHGRGGWESCESLFNVNTHTHTHTHAYVHTHTHTQSCRIAESPIKVSKRKTGSFVGFLVWLEVANFS